MSVRVWIWISKFQCIVSDWSWTSVDKISARTTQSWHISGVRSNGNNNHQSEVIDINNFTASKNNSSQAKWYVGRPPTHHPTSARICDLGNQKANIITLLT